MEMPEGNLTRGSRLVELASYALPHQLYLQTASTVLLAVIHLLLSLLELALRGTLFMVTGAVSVVVSAKSAVRHTIDLHSLQQVTAETSPPIPTPTKSSSPLIPLTPSTTSSTPLLHHTTPTACTSASLEASEDDLDGILVYSFLGEPAPFFPNADEEHGLELESLDLSLLEMDDVEHALVTGAGQSVSPVSPVSIAATPTTIGHILLPPSDSPLSEGAATNASIGSFTDVFDDLSSIFEQSINTDADDFASEGEIHRELSWYCTPLSDSTTWYAVTVGRRIGIYDNWADACPAAQHIHGNLIPQISSVFASQNRAVSYFHVALARDQVRLLY